MRYNKKYYTNNGFLELKYCVITPVWACDCPYDNRLFITKEYVCSTINDYSLWDKETGLRLNTFSKLKDLKTWYLTKGKEAYLKVVKNNLAHYQERKANYKKLLEAL